MDLKVVSKKWGKYSKGDVLKNVPLTTANALIKHGVVEDAATKKETTTKKRK